LQAGPGELPDLFENDCLYGNNYKSDAENAEYFFTNNPAKDEILKQFEKNCVDKT
jgi:hypothetical protein